MGPAAGRRSSIIRAERLARALGITLAEIEAAEPIPRGLLSYLPWSAGSTRTRVDSPVCHFSCQRYSSLQLWANQMRHIGYLWHHIGGEAAAFRLNKGDTYAALQTSQLVRDTSFQRGAHFHAIAKLPGS